MIDVLIWGTGKKSNEVLRLLDKSKCSIRGYIDNNPKKRGTFFNGLPVFSYNNELIDFDYIIVSPVAYKAIQYQLEMSNEDMNKIIFFFREGEPDIFSNIGIIDENKWRISVLEERIHKLESLVNIRFSNVKYEILDCDQREEIRFPIIESNEKAIKRIVDDSCSLIRFGDGEFEIIEGKERAPFQNFNMNLAKRLLSVLQSENEKLLIAIADNYGKLDKYTVEVADGIRNYMTEEVRQNHWKYINPDKTYYDTYMFKCYYPYRDKEGTKDRVALVKRIWDGRDIVLVEGDKTRTGYGNDLLDNARSIQRIIGPTKNAFDKYNTLLETIIEKVHRDKLILMVLGPAGKVMAYDLFEKGYQVIDIGQIDMDYDWYKAEAETRIPNPYKYISQLPEAEVLDINDDEYIGQIIVDLS